MTLNAASSMLADFVVKSFERSATPTEAELRERLEALAPVVASFGGATTEADREAVLRELLSRLRVSMDLGTSLKEADVKPWLDSRRATIDPFYWVRFRNYLQKGWPPEVLRSFDRVTDDILDLCGNPAAPEPSWNRRGLVIGDVQSGKTATYTALCCKAADAGYQVIVLLTGTLESLRRQTQKRLDEGFAGLDSSEFLPSNRKALIKSRAVGAGLGNQARFAAVFTSRTRDFNKDVLNSRQLTLGAVKEPVLFVVKKHKSIIENLATWLQAYNAGSDGMIGESLLLIDDEADNASINTNSPEVDPTAVNRSIRHLLSVFRRRTYVGFTATPFANVFIDPDVSDQDFHKQELFPRDFIYALEAPTNYIGAGSVFGDESDRAMLRSLEDAGEVFPLKHKQTLVVDTLPVSLVKAIHVFCLANAIRDLRGEGISHRSMLVNVSRFTAVQDRVRDLLDAAADEIKQHVRNFSRLSEAQALRSPVLARMKAVFLEEYSAAGATWLQVQEALHDAVSPIAVRSVNQRAGAASLDYTKHEESGLRVIAVGGNSLSRGLTLEGLCVSYFHRDAQAYDTLLQMGRWFGYRPGYDDLCRLWITPSAQQWYAHVALAAEELRDEVKRMRRLDLTPKDFGLKVRCHQDTLIVTARNKMRSSGNYIKRISWSGEMAETTKLVASANGANIAATRRLLRKLWSPGSEVPRSEWQTPLFRASKEDVATFLESFEVHPHNFSLYVPQDERGEYGLAHFLRSTTEPKLQWWDVAIPQGSLDERVFLGLEGLRVKPLQRFVLTAGSAQTILVSGTKARVGSRGTEREGIAKEQVDRLIEERKPKNLPDKELRQIRERPLLLLYGIVPFNKDKDEAWTGLVEGDYLVAYGLSFPVFDDTGPSKTVAYRVNKTWLRDHSVEEDLDEYDDDDDPATED